MSIRISKREVFNNLLQIKGGLAKHSAEAKRSYAAFLNRHTGDLRFGMTEFDSSVVGADWEQVDLIQDKSADRVAFHCASIHKESDGASLRIDAAAVGVLLETLDVLNQLAELAHGAVGRALDHLEAVELESQRERLESLPGWRGRLSRVEAERALEGRGIGAYVLHIDSPMVEMIAEAFERANKIRVKFYLLTFNSGKGKISERVLIETQWGWTFCRDDSNLASPAYRYSESPSELLKTLGSQIQSPV